MMVVHRCTVHPDCWVEPIVEGDRSLRGVAWEWMDAPTLALYDLFEMTDTATCNLARSARVYGEASGSAPSEILAIVSSLESAGRGVRQRLGEILTAAEVDLLIEPSERVPCGAWSPAQRYSQRCLYWWRGDLHLGDWGRQVRERLWLIGDREVPRLSRRDIYDAANEPRLPEEEQAA